MSLPDDSALTSARIDVDFLGSAATGNLGRRTRAAVDLQIENASVFSQRPHRVGEEIDVVLDCSCNVLQMASPAASGLFASEAPLRRRSSLVSEGKLEGRSAFAASRLRRDNFSRCERERKVGGVDGARTRGLRRDRHNVTQATRTFAVTYSGCHAQVPRCAVLDLCILTALS